MNALEETRLARSATPIIMRARRDSAPPQRRSTRSEAHGASSNIMPTATAAEVAPRAADGRQHNMRRRRAEVAEAADDVDDFQHDRVDAAAAEASDDESAPAANAPKRSRSKPKRDRRQQRSGVEHEHERDHGYDAHDHSTPLRHCLVGSPCACACELR